MKQNFIKISMLALVSSALFSCSKSKESTNISQPLTVIGEPLTETTLPVVKNGVAVPLKGTMLAGNTYTINADVSINAGDTLYIQPGAKIEVAGNGKLGSSPVFVVNGSIISDGTKDAPIWFSVKETPTTPKSNSTYVNDQPNDPAYKGYWSGFQGTASCKLMAFRWTHIEYTGGPLGVSAVITGGKDADPAPAIYMASDATGAYGKFILEDSWLYGSVDDCIGKCQHVYVSIMRNTLSKLGGIGGEGVNLKNDVYGDMAYNLCYGIATNGLKTASIDGQSTIVNIYNNTLVNCGFRQQKATRNGSINTETKAGGFIYNNIIVNCKQGLRITYSSQKGTPSDTINTSYNNNLTFIGTNVKNGADFLLMYIEPLQYTLKQSNDINGYVNGTIVATGDNMGTNAGTNVVDTTKYNPMFKNYDAVVNARGNSYLNYMIPANADFHLAAGSPAIGAGVFPGGTGKNAMPAKANAPLLAKYQFPSNVLNGSTGAAAAKITPPNKDLGAFPTDGSGNQHTY